MVKRSTWVMIILLVLAAALYWYLQKPDNLVSKAIYAGATPTGEVFGALVSPDDEVEGFTLQAASGKSVSITHENGLWMVDTGKKEVADQEAAASAIIQAQALQLVGKVASAPDLTGFGLEQPSYVLKLNILNGTPIIFKIGNPTVTGNGYYLQKEDGKVVIVTKYGIEYLTNLLDEPPLITTPTPTPAPVTETPTVEPTTIYTQTAIPELTATKAP